MIKNNLDMYNHNEVPINPSRKWIKEHVKKVYCKPTYKLFKSDLKPTLDICICGCCLNINEKKCRYCDSEIEWQ